MLSKFRALTAAGSLRLAGGLLAVLVLTPGCPNDDRPPPRTPRKHTSKKRPKLPDAAPKELKRLYGRGGWLPGKPIKSRYGMWELIHEKSGLVFIHVPGGSFMMGDELGDKDAQPVREVTLKPYMLCKHEVSQKAWDEIGGYDSRSMVGPNLPINNITWNEARAWCKVAGFRLPSEAEWEYAARANSASNWVSGAPKALAAFAWYSENAKNNVHPVGTRRPNAWGFHDMAGNVAEWCQDIYAYYDKCPTDGSAMKTGGSLRVLRGGNFSDDARVLASTYRNRAEAGSRSGGPGVRPAVTLR